jgi:hypothetical protein
MDLQTIARLTRLPLRKVRYAVDQKLLPGMRGRRQDDQAGRPRSYTALEGYFIALAALLLEGGVRRQTIVVVMERLVNLAWPLPGCSGQPSTYQKVVGQPATAAEALYRWAVEPTRLWIGDGINLRLQLGPIDSGWFEPRQGIPLRADYQPQVLIQVDLKGLQEKFRSEGAK